MKTIILIVVAIAVSGCFATSMQQVDQMIGAGQPQTYKNGFMDGCDSGHAALNQFFKFSKDVQQYGENSLYQQGWDDGYDRCKSWERKWSR